MFIKKIQTKINHVFKQKLARNILWELFAKLASVLMQTTYFVIVARFLGSANYGSFVAVTALASLVFPFASLGSGHILVQNVSRNRKTFNYSWGNSIFIVCNCSLVLIGILFILSPIFFAQNIDRLAILLILIADLLCLSFCLVCTQAFISIDSNKKSAQFQILQSSTKLVFAFILAFCFEKPSIVDWSILYLIAAAFISLVGIFIVSQQIAKPKLSLSKIKQGISQGIYFSISESANNINTDIDKTMLASMSTLAATGIYGAAYRCIYIGFIPIFAIISGSYAKFFEYGAFGIDRSLSLAKRLLPVMLAYGIAILVSFLLLAPLLPIVLGEEYKEVADVIRWLSPIPLMAGIQFLVADTLTGAGFQKVRSFIQVSAAILNILLNLWLIPTYSWKGAVIATLFADSLRLLCLVIAVIILHQKQKRYAKTVK